MQLSTKQKEYIKNANARWNFKIGAVRSGKSFVDISYVVPARLRAVAGKPGLAVILGVSRDTIERNVLEPMREIYTQSLVSHINGRNQAYICGEWVYCLGAEKVSQVAKIQGSSIKYAYGDEVAKWNPEVFTMLQSRLDKEYSCFDGSLNPEYPNHWLKDFIDRPDLDAFIQRYIIDDNPFLPKEYIENLKKEYAGTVYYDRYILGLWALAEGLIYPMYKQAWIDSIPEAALSKTPEYCISMDYGTMNAFAMLLWEKHNDGIWYATRRYYYSGRDTGVQKTDQEYLADIETTIYDILEDFRQGNVVKAAYGDVMNAKIPVIIDPSAASFIALLKKTDWAKVIPANNAVADGLRETASAIKSDKIKVLSSIPEWKKEIEGYAWDDTTGEDKPIKENDHLMDAMRYFVKTKHIMKQKTKYNGIFY